MPPAKKPTPIKEPTPAKGPIATPHCCHAKPWVIATTLLGGILFGFLVGVAAPIQVSTGTPAPAAEQQYPAPSVDDDAVLGDPDAPVTLIEFSDFQCPFCRRFFEESYAQIKTNYIDTGKAKLVFRDYPLPFHPAGVPSARAAECAAEQDLFWEMHDQIFTKQAEKGVNTIEYGAPELKQWAAELPGIDSTSFSACLDSTKYTDEVEADLAAGIASGVNGTPTVFVDGKPIVGAQPYAAFAAAIEAALQD